MSKRIVNKSAYATLRLLARHERNKNRVLAIHGLDAATVCVCDNEVDAEVIVIALNEARERHATLQNPTPGSLRRMA